MPWLVPLVVFLGACVFDPRGVPPSSHWPPNSDLLVGDTQGGGADLLDGGADGPHQACSDWTPRPVHFDPCQIQPPGVGLTLAAPGQWSYDTTSGALTDPQGHPVASPPSSLVGNPPTRVLSVLSFDVGADVKLRAVGDHPLVVASWSTATVAGTLDVGSYRGDSTPGAGSNPTTCASHAPQAGQTVGIAGGGGGGAGFGDDGGAGGAGNVGRVPGGAGGARVSVPVAIRGGCHGAGGGDSGGSGGYGGGALQLTARTAIEVAATGKLLAGGAGGQGGSAGQRGAGGGGSGGYLGLEAPTVTLVAAAILAANGGGGGEGSSVALDGNSGIDGQAAAKAASGAYGTATGGNGGAGGWRDNTAGTPGAQDPSVGGGGGGGGGVGFILVRSSQLDHKATASPGITTP